MNTLYFEKISQYDRQREPVSVSVPFAKGTFTPGQSLVIHDGDSGTLPVQQRPLAHWDDGSVKWLLAHFQPDLPGNRDKTLTFEIAGSEAAAPDVPVSVSQIQDGLHVDTGPLRFDVPDDGFYPVRNVHLNGESLGDTAAFQGFALGYDERMVTTIGPVEL